MVEELVIHSAIITTTINRRQRIQLHHGQCIQKNLLAECKLADKTSNNQMDQLLNIIVELDQKGFVIKFLELIHLLSYFCYIKQIQINPLS